MCYRIEDDDKEKREREDSSEQGYTKTAFLYARVSSIHSLALEAKQEEEGAERLTYSYMPLLGWDAIR